MSSCPSGILNLSFILTFFFLLLIIEIIIIIIVVVVAIIIITIIIIIIISTKTRSAQFNQIFSDKPQRSHAHAYTLTYTCGNALYRRI